MSDASEHLPAIIAEAAKSPLGLRNGVVRFEIPWEEATGDALRDVRNSYTGRLLDDRIEFVVQNDNGDPPVSFRAKRTAQGFS